MDDSRILFLCSIFQQPYWYYTVVISLQSVHSFQTMITVRNVRSRNDLCFCDIATCSSHIHAHTFYLVKVWSPCQSFSKPQVCKLSFWSSKLWNRVGYLVRVVVFAASLWLSVKTKLFSVSAAARSGYIDIALGQCIALPNPNWEWQSLHLSHLLLRETRETHLRTDGPVETVQLKETVETVWKSAQDAPAANLPKPSYSSAVGGLVQARWCQF